MEIDSEDESMVDEGKIPSFCVLLHGALKVENMAALCFLAEDWFGIVYSWADSKKKSNLMLTILEPGSNVVPWLGNLNRLGSLDDFHSMCQDNGPEPSFPVRPLEKRSYSQNCVVWIRQAGLQSDIQKILRHARKLPDKTQQFYKVGILKYRYRPLLCCEISHFKHQHFRSECVWCVTSSVKKIPQFLCNYILIYCCFAIVNICVCVYIYIHTYIYIYTHTGCFRRNSKY